MKFRPVRTSAPAELPLTVDECKRHAVVEFDEQDAVVSAAIASVVADLDGFAGLLGRAIITQTWELALPCWQRSFVLPVPDVASASISYLDVDGATQDGPAVTLHAVDAGTLVSISKDWIAPTLFDDSPAPVLVSFVCGYGSAADVPDDLKLAMMQRVAQAFDDREGEGRPGAFADRLIAKHRWLNV